MTKLTTAQIDLMFEPRTLNEEQQNRTGKIRESARSFAIEIVQHVPEGPDQLMAIAQTRAAMSAAVEGIRAMKSPG